MVDGRWSTKQGGTTSAPCCASYHTRCCSTPWLVLTHFTSWSPLPATGGQQYVSLPSLRLFQGEGQGCDHCHCGNTHTTSATLARAAGCCWVAKSKWKSPPPRTSRAATVAPVQLSIYLKCGQTDQLPKDIRKWSMKGLHILKSHHHKTDPSNHKIKIISTLSLTYFFFLQMELLHQHCTRWFAIFHHQKALIQFQFKTAEKQYLV